MYKKALFSLQDKVYKDFNQKLLPNIAPQKVIGVRMPLLRKLAQRLYKEDKDHVRSFLADLPHEYLEENHLHALFIGQERNFDTAISLTEKFLPHIDNWQTCDLFRPPILRQNKAKLLPYLEKFLRQEDIYAVRFAVGFFIEYLGTPYFSPEINKKIAALKSDAYYINK